MMASTGEAFTRTHCLSRNVPLNLTKLAQNRTENRCGKTGIRFIKRKPWGGNGSTHPIEGSTRNGLHCIDHLMGSIRHNRQKLVVEERIQGCFCASFGKSKKEVFLLC